MKKSKELKELEKEREFYQRGYNSCKEDALILIDELQNNASNERKISKDKKYWLGCCQILNELKTRIKGVEELQSEVEEGK